MVCKGLRNDEEVPKSCDTGNSRFYDSSLFHEMANACFGRWGRRKQANPKRTNHLDDTPLEADPDQIPATEANPQSSSHHDNQLHLNNCDMTQEFQAEPVTLETKTEGEAVSEETEINEMAPLSKEVDDTRIDEARTPTNPEPSSPQATPEHTVTNGSDSNQNYSNCQTNSLATEDENIQELMSRSDTAVIFPEPVSDQEEGNNTTENEDLGDLEEEFAKCPHCDQAYSDTDQLKDHWQAVHNTQKTKYGCPQCNISFLSKNQLDKHLALHSPSAQICKICKKTFANVYRLQRHMISHEESSELRKFKCPECHKAFKFKHHLKEHIRIHSGEKPFECQNCGKRFSHSGSYSSHMTSKKCWIVNMKMRGSTPTSRLEKQDGARPAIIPKAMENMNLAMMYSSGLLPQQFLPFDAAAATQIQTQYLAQINGSQNPFLPHIPFTTSMTNPMIPGLTSIATFGCLPPGGADVEAKICGSQSEMAALVKPVDELLAKTKEPTPIRELIDENMNKELTKGKLDESVAELEETKEKKLPELEQMMVSENKPEGLETINKVLEIVGATVNQQQQAGDDKAALSKLSPDTTENESRTLTALASAATQQLQQLMKETKCDSPAEIKTEIKTEIKSEINIQNNNLICRFCQDAFSSPIHLHQHERYLCKENHEIQRTESELVHNGAVSSPVPSNSLDESLDDYEAERKIRVRSMITEEQVQVLKSFYQSNQRPNKFELEGLARQIGFPKRVVQVWFQNMRARDRRKGRVIRDGKSEQMSPPMTSTAYIPNVPQVAMPSFLNNYYASSAAPKTNGHNISVYNSSASPQRACEANFEAEQPLDLTMKLPQAHTCKPFSSKPDPSDSVEVLNLSIRSVLDSSHTQKESSPAPATVAETAFQRYTSNMVEGAPSASVPLVVPVVTSACHSPLAMSIPLQINTTPAHTKSYASVSSMQHPIAFNQSPAHAHYHSTPKSAYDPVVPLASSPSLVSSDLISPRPSSLDSSFNSTLSLDSHPDSSAAAYGIKTKRSRKKSWRQVEAEELHDIDESVGDSDCDSPLRKKRRSWKQHRVDVAEGLYACDQCDKMFNKQSSLARHKYEHSGQRPFPCDICTKAFKHKHHLTEHKRLHSGEKPFQCQKCGKRFSHSGSYSQHMNHRYKYCKPLMGEDCENEDLDLDAEHSETSPSP